MIYDKNHEGHKKKVHIFIMRKDSFVKFHFKASTGFSVNRPNFAQKSSSLALNTREFHEDYKEIPGFALGNTENQEKCPKQ